jgi:ADP-dependent NAD(P)H-hydrate dehydratase / NAD(P)H-hydrate epimerase
VSTHDEDDERVARERETIPALGREREGASAVEGATIGSRVLRWSLRLFILLIVLAGIGAAIVYVYWDDILRARIEREARERGVSLTYESFVIRGLLPWQSGPAEVLFTEVTVALEEQPDVITKAKSVHVALEGTKPKVVTVDDADVKAPTLQSLFELEAALAARPKSGRPLPEVNVKGAKLVVAKALPDSLPWKLTALVRAIRIDQPITSLEDLAISVTTSDKKKYGPWVVDILLDEKEIAIAVEKLAAKLVVARDLSKASAKLEKFSKDDAKRALALISVDASWLAGIPTFAISGTLEAPLAWPPRAKGKFDVELPGFVPPHPRELNGIVFGKTTYATAVVDLNEQGASGDVTVKNGALSVKGKVDASLASKEVKLELSGSINCAELATSAVGAHLGFAASMIAGQIARDRVGGTVFVTIKAEASAKDKWKPVVVPSANVRCSVRIL